jgi:H+/Cl- antiporter ClcA
MMMTVQEKMYLSYLFFAYTGLFLIMFGFLYKMLRKSRDLLRQVKMLDKEWQGHGAYRSAEETAPVVPNVRGREV